MQWAVAAAVVFALSGGYYIPWAWRAALLILLVLIAATSWTQLNAQPEGDDSRTDS